jgi:hypothetical protein
MKQLTCREIAARIDAHLKRFEADASPYDLAYTTMTANAIYISYDSGVERLDKSEALAYLAWLDAGNVGKHWEMKK